MLGFIILIVICLALLWGAWLPEPTVTSEDLKSLRKTSRD